MSKITRSPITMTVLAALAGLHAASCSDDGMPKGVQTSVPAVPGRSGVVHNAITMNALTTNALTTNAANLRALIASKLADASFESGSLSEALWDPSAQQVMAYLVSCALAPGQSVTWRPASSVGPPPAVSTWEGALGLCPQWHEGSITGDAACQELVSACLLARNNAFGVEVQISLRGRDTSEAYFGSSDVLVGDVVHPEHELYRWSEGAFYGNILDAGAVDGTLEVRVHRDAVSGEIEVRYASPGDATPLQPAVFEMSANDYAASSATARLLRRDQGHGDFMSRWQGGKTLAYRNAFACWSSEWSEAAAYFHQRTCAGPSDKERCLAQPMGACQSSAVLPGAPQFMCNEVRSPPLGHGDFDDCTAADRLWR
ncbi:MAG TPA: hypothetical protein VNM90_31095, partial [Haliangium sp.]|nr:hypothetical protein [Haliangium sp.]